MEMHHALWDIRAPGRVGGRNDHSGGDVSTANAQTCRKNYYRCDLNRDGRIDPANPNCCWSPMAGPPSTSCPRNYYKCDLNAGGRVDPEHPGCCWNLR